MRLRVLTYNVHKCIGGADRRYRPERVVQTIEHHDPDLVLLQECANGSGRRGWHKQVDLLGDAVELRHRSWVPNHSFRRGGEYGNAILSKWPIVETANVVVSTPGRKTRSVLHANIRVRSKSGATRAVHVFCLHLGLTERARDQQMQRFLQCQPFARLHSRTPIIVGGDFNDVWGSIGEKHLVPRGFSGSKRIRTFPAWAPVQALDGLYVRGDLKLTDVQRSRLGVARAASDHLPLVSVMQLAF